MGMNAPAPAPGAPAPQPAPAPAPAAPAPPPTQPGQPAPAAPPADEPQQFSREYVQEIRREAAKYRTHNNELVNQLDQLKKGFANALGIKVDGQAPDPEQMQSQMTVMKLQLRSSKMENAVIREAGKQKVNLDLLRGQLMASGEWDKLDPDDNKFSDSLHSAVKAIADAYPVIKDGQAPTPPPTTSGVPAGGGQPPSTQWTMDDVAKARREHREGDISKALASGKLNAILKRPV